MIKKILLASAVSVLFSLTLSAAPLKLAELSGLSVRTVNRVLKDQGDVSPAKRALVRELAAKYNYMPNIAARNFRLRRKNMLESGYL